MWAARVISRWQRQVLPPLPLPVRFSLSSFSTAAKTTRNKESRASADPNNIRHQRRAHNHCHHRNNHNHNHSSSLRKHNHNSQQHHAPHQRRPRQTTWRDTSSAQLNSSSVHWYAHAHKTHSKTPSGKALFMAFEIVPEEEVVQVVMSDGVGDVCEHFAKKVRTRDRKGSRLALPPRARGYEHGAAEGAFVR